MSSKNLFSIYLNDHIAASVGGIEMVKRTRAKNQGTPLGDYLAVMEAELAEDQRIVKGMLAAIGVPENLFKQTAMWFVEKVGRLKPNAQLSGYSPLSRVFDLEVLQMAVTGRIAMLRGFGALDPQELISTAEVERLLARAEEQRERLGAFHHAAFVSAFDSAPGAGAASA